jgi:integrase
MAFIQRLERDRYRARYRSPDGRERSRTFRRKSDAVRFLSAVEADKARGEWIDPKLARITFTRWADRWSKTTVHLKPKTRAGYESLLRTHILPAFGGVSIGQIQPVQVREWIAHLSEGGLSASRIRQAYQLLSAILKSAVESGFLARSPCVGVALPKARRREMHFLSAPAVASLGEAISEPYETLVYLLAYGGLRWGEAAGLRRGRCHLLRSRIEIVESASEVGGTLYFGATKTYQSRSVVLPAFLRDMMAAHLARYVDGGPEALVFTNGAGGPLRNSNFRNRTWRPAVRAAELPEALRIHDLRHTCAALLIAEGAHPKAIQAHLGHSSIQVTLDLYGHLYPDEMDRLADRLDAAHDANPSQVAASVRPGSKAEVLEFPLRGEKTAPDQGFYEWGGLDSNQRPADYESAALTN